MNIFRANQGGFIQYMPPKPVTYMHHYFVSQEQEDLERVSFKKHVVDNRFESLKVAKQLLNHNNGTVKKLRFKKERND